MLDIEVVVDIVYEYGIFFIIDNMVLSFYFFCFIDFGVDIVVYFVIKFFGGYGIVIGGVIVDSGKFDWEVSGKFSDLIISDLSYYGFVYIEVVGEVVYVIKVCV